MIFPTFHFFIIRVTGRGFHSDVSIDETSSQLSVDLQGLFFFSLSTSTSTTQYISIRSIDIESAVLYSTISDYFRPRGTTVSCVILISKHESRGAILI